MQDKRKSSFLSKTTSKKETKRSSCAVLPRLCLDQNTVEYRPGCVAGGSSDVSRVNLSKAWVDRFEALSVREFFCYRVVLQVNGFQRHGLGIDCGHSLQSRTKRKGREVNASERNKKRPWISADTKNAKVEPRLTSKLSTKL